MLQATFIDELYGDMSITKSEGETARWGRFCLSAGWRPSARRGSFIVFQSRKTSMSFTICIVVYWVGEAGEKMSI